MAKKYTFELKQEILDFASNHSLKETANKYGCNILSIHRWRKETKKNLPIPYENHQGNIDRLKLQVFALDSLKKELDKKILDLENLVKNHGKLINSALCLLNELRC
jgi:transposase-like protein